MMPLTCLSCCESGTWNLYLLVLFLMRCLRPHSTAYFVYITIWCVLIKPTSLFNNTLVLFMPIYTLTCLFSHHVHLHHSFQAIFQKYPTPDGFSQSFTTRNPPDPHRNSSSETFPPFLVALAIPVVPPMYHFLLEVSTVANNVMTLCCSALSLSLTPAVTWAGWGPILGSQLWLLHQIVSIPP